MSILDDKYARLQAGLAELGSLLLAFSGGVDSTLLLAVAKQVLGERVVALTVTSPVYPQGELVEAQALAARLGVRQLVLDSDELAIPGFAENPKNRCYLCKQELFTLCRQQADSLGLAAIADGSNVDDLADYRPGRQAAQEAGVVSPLLAAGLGKAEIRELSRRLGLPTAEKQAYACLASRFPYGSSITPELLARIEACEEFLKAQGFTVYRVRCHDELARIETGPAELARLAEPELRLAVADYFRGQGFRFVTVDLDGYRTGSFN